MREEYLHAELFAMKKDPWSTQGECGQCSGLKVLRRKAIASGALILSHDACLTSLCDCAGDQARRQWVEQKLKLHRTVARMDRLCYHVRIERGIQRPATWSSVPLDRSAPRLVRAGTRYTAGVLVLIVLCVCVCE